jgi:hypothetical protein
MAHMSILVEARDPVGIITCKLFQVGAAWGARALATRRVQARHQELARFAAMDLSPVDVRVNALLQGDTLQCSAHGSWR